MSYGDFSKPLRPPPSSRVWDRSSGRRAARVYDILRRPSRTPGARRAPDRGVAIARLRARYTAVSPLWKGTAALLVVSACLAVADTSVESRHRTPLSEDAAGYASLVVALETACPRDRCAYGVGVDEGDPAPPEVRALMSRLRLYTATYDTRTAEVWIHGRLWTDPLVYRDLDPTPAQHHTRKLREAFESRPTAPDPPSRYASLGGGWYTVQP